MNYSLMTKNEKKAFMSARGYVYSYSGKLGKGFIKKVSDVSIHAVVNMNV